MTFGILHSNWPGTLQSQSHSFTNPQVETQTGCISGEETQPNQTALRQRWRFGLVRVGTSGVRGSSLVACRSHSVSAIVYHFCKHDPDPRYIKAAAGPSLPPTRLTRVACRLRAGPRR